MKFSQKIGRKEEVTDENKVKKFVFEIITKDTSILRIQNIGSKIFLC